MTKPMMWLVCAFFLLTGCTTDEEMPCPQPFSGSLTEDEATLAGTWELTALTASEEIDLTDDNVDNPSTDLLSQLDACSQVAIYQFGTDRNIKYSGGLLNGETCQEQVLLEGTWALSGSSIGVVTGCRALYFPPVEFAEEGVSFSFTEARTVFDALGQGVQLEITETYTKVVE
ncbi:DUF5004 domain-containing protein [Robertkochia marina]|uniref:DUF5004 domain-containing protein n=1 Tax=Robertkochia marina TaxID=1227945 RepID=A0A4S3M3C2_9FLAO|nr:DUF5004 domain-containing protein [Robertkochia marina]THD69235.1 DUF5004 domain-containing protein [Robertkochia marina]TRZ47506.1 DUF5004 domain-containing protein [Robertkochia marina]